MPSGTVIGTTDTQTLTNKTIAAGSNTISGLTNSNLSGTAGITNANLANSTISGVALGSNLNTLTMGVSGTGLSGSTTFNGSGAATFTVTSNATNANTVSAIVARDASGNFSAGTITAALTGNVTGNVSGSSGSCTGNSASATTATNLSGGLLTNYSETVNVLGNTGTAKTINLANGNFVTATLTGNCTFTFTTGVSSGAIAFTLFLTNDATAGRLIIWPASVKWPSATVPSRSTAASKTDVYTFISYNNGATWFGNLALYNYS